MRAFALAATLVLGACASTTTYMPPPLPPVEEFLSAIALPHCGKAYEGRMVSSDPADSDIAGKRLVMHIRECGPGVIRVPFHVGSDRSRTWILKRTPGGLQLKHDHRHEDGSPDVLTMYGGNTVNAGTKERQQFPVDKESVALFMRENRAVSTTNVWAMEITPTMFAYELRRPPIPGGRFFRVEFDLTKPVAPPPPPWGAKF